MISKCSVVIASKQQIASDLAGEVVILHLSKGEYYSLDEVGAYVWNLIQAPRSVEELRDAVVEEYEVEHDECERDIVALLEELEDVGLVEIKASI
jgi:hypothetical protein